MSDTQPIGYGRTPHMMLIAKLMSDVDRPSWVRDYATKNDIELLKTRYDMRVRSRRDGGRTDTWYQRYLLSQHWQNFRLAVLVIGGGQCARCWTVADEVHHLNYNKWWSERLCDVEPLCSECHRKEHSNGEVGNLGFDRIMTILNRLARKEREERCR